MAAVGRVPRNPETQPTPLPRLFTVAPTLAGAVDLPTRLEPSPSSSVTGFFLPTDAPILVTALEGDWALVDHGRGACNVADGRKPSADAVPKENTGWVRYRSPDGTFLLKPISFVFTEQLSSMGAALNARDAPSPSGNIIAKCQCDEVFAPLEIRGDWLLCHGESTTSVASLSHVKTFWVMHKQSGDGGLVLLVALDTQFDKTGAPASVAPPFTDKKIDLECENGDNSEALASQDIPDAPAVGPSRLSASESGIADLEDDLHKSKHEEANTESHLNQKSPESSARSPSISAAAENSDDPQKYQMGKPTSRGEGVAAGSLDAASLLQLGAAESVSPLPSTGLPGIVSENGLLCLGDLAAARPRTPTRPSKWPRLVSTLPPFLCVTIVT